MADSSAEAVTAILNDEAGDKQGATGQKRKMQSNVRSTSTKSIAVEIPIHVGATPTRQSGRLKARASLAALRLVPRGDPFSFPDGPEEAPGQNTSANPVKRLRRLNRSKQPEESPFKGRGVLQTRSTAQVNLDDSPQRQPARDPLRKIAKSLQRVPRLAGRQEITRPSSTATNGVPFLGEDILDVLSRQDGAPQVTSPIADPEPLLPDLPDLPDLPYLPVAAPVPDHAANVPRTEPPLAILADETSLLAEIRESELFVTEPNGAHKQVQGPNGKDEQVGRSNVPPHGTQRTRNEKSPPEANGDDREDDERPHTNDRSAGYDAAHGTRPGSTAQRPETEAERRAREQKEAEEEVKRQEQIKRALRGVEEAILVHGCEESWQTALVGAFQLVEGRPTNEATSTLGKAAARALKELTRDYKKLERLHPPPRQEFDQIVRENYRVLKERCKLIDDHRVREEMGDSGERVDMFKDIYWHLIPASLMLDKAALKALFRCGDGQLSSVDCEELYPLLKITSLLLETATSWQPRPELENSAKSIVRNEIRPSVIDIMKRYRERYQHEIMEVQRHQYRDELEARQKEDLARLWTAVQQKRAKKLARLKADLNRVNPNPSRYMPNSRSSSQSSPQPSLQQSSQPIVDIDDLDAEDQADVNGDASDFAEASPHSYQQGRPVERPRLRREPTEDIPPPAPDQWENSEIALLVKGLRKYQGVSRFEDIVERYGGPGGGLEKYDMDQVMAQAKWLRQSLAQKLNETRRDPAWDWLRSVPN